MKSNRLPIVVTALVTGFFVAAQIAAHSKVNVLTKSDDFRVLAVETAELIKNIDKLETEKKSLDDQHQQLEKSNPESQDALKQDINRFNIVSGTTAVSGEGIEIKFDKPLVVSELIDLMNALRNIGAEAMALNDRRVVDRTGFSLQDGKAPLTIKVIGKRELLKQAVSRRGGILEQIGHGSVAEQSVVTLEAVK